VLEHRGGGSGGGGGGDSGGSSGGSSSSSSGGAGDSGSGGDAGLNTLQGTFSSNSGIQATFTGAVSGRYTGGTATWETGPQFGDIQPATSTGITITNPPNSNGATFGVAILLAPGMPAAGTFPCSDPSSSANPHVSANFDIGGVEYAAGVIGFSGGTCTVTIDMPTLEADGDYFAHGSLTSSLVAKLTDGGQGTGTMTAAW